MKHSLYHIALIDLLWMFIPVGIVVFFYYHWTKDSRTLTYALARMLLQLLGIGYLLVYIFHTKSPYLVGGILAVMLVAAAIISMRPLPSANKHITLALISIIIGGLFTLGLVLFGVLKPKPWFDPQVVIPLAGMIFANSMNAVSIAAERLHSERLDGKRPQAARAAAYQAALIPIINSLFAVGLVSLPGMMTGQILSGVDPLIAVRYQMMVMLMILGSAGISVAVYLLLQSKTFGYNRTI
jgi:putative ABC transport system permease protein